ncbi:hypothetical protein F4775DRAFT_114808 [Biscogniauxia sp. FL1348]|nr:hypothetical protein F4775DRAFT_114808 [Biscogniauxia sp. FL1348]
MGTAEAKGHAQDRVLLTGGSGFIASHILDGLLNAGFHVVVTTRSEEKGRRIVESVGPSRLSYVVVDDITKDGAFDGPFKSDAPFDYVVHTAMPYHMNVQDPVKEFLDPAIKGTTGLLKSIKRNAPTVKRVVITSSSAAILNPGNHAKLYDETYWAPFKWEDAADPKKAYVTSKVLSEKAAWAFIEDEKPNFDLAVINGTYTFGPIQRKLPSLDAMNTSNHRIRDLIQGKMRGALQPTAPVFTFVDVRDVALAHLRAMTLPQAGGNRFYVVGGHFSNKRLAEIIRKSFPQFAERLPPVDAADDFPDDVYQFNNSKSRELLGLEYTALETSIVDTVQSIIDSGLLK